MDALARHPEIGQVLFTGFPGIEPTQAAALVRQLRPAGLVLVPRNIQSAGQVLDLTSGLQAVAREAGMPRLLFGLDQEGGSITRLSASHGFTDLPSAMAVGIGADPAAARDLAAVAGQELAAVGANVNLAPVLDLALDPANTVIGTRSYGPDPELVAAMGRAVIDGLQAAGVLACAKHVPGHGATDIDSHLGLPRLRSTPAELRGRDLVPFAAAVEAGCAAVMTAHVLSALDPATPATLSPMVGAMLRTELGFDGLIITDALEMRALDQTAVPSERRGLEALRAGADLLLFEGDLELVLASIDAIADGLDRGEFSGQRLTESAGRLAAARRRIDAALPRPELGGIGSDAHRTLALQVATDGLRIRGRQPLPLERSPAVLDVASGSDLAAALDWPLIAAPADAAGAPVVVAVADADIEADTRAAIASARAEGVPVLLVVLTGWQTPRDIEVEATIHALDLPPGLWAAIKQRVGPRSDRPDGGGRT